MRKILFCLLVNFSLVSFSQAAFAFDVYGHLGLYGEKNTSNNNSSYAGLNASIGIDAQVSNFAFGIGGWAGIPVYENTKRFADNIYKDTFVLSDIYFGYVSTPLTIKVGRYDTNDMGYEWFSGHNEGASLKVDLSKSVSFWLLYSYEQAFQFQRVNRETASQINTLWNYKRHGNRDHLFGVGVDLLFANLFRVSPYVFLVTDVIAAPGVTLELLFGKKSDLYSQTQFKYTLASYSKRYYLNNTNNIGQLFLIDQEFGYSWFKIGAGYFQTSGNGLGGLTYYGDRSRFYGGIVGANFNNKGRGSYFDGKQSSWYIFTGARTSLFKFDILYAGGDYEEFSALLSLTLFRHLDLGVGYVDLADIQNNRRNYLSGFIKAVW